MRLEEWQPSHDHEAQSLRSKRGRWEVRKSPSPLAIGSGDIRSVRHETPKCLSVQALVSGVSAVTFLTDKAGPAGGGGMKINPNNPMPGQVSGG